MEASVRDMLNEIGLSRSLPVIRWAGIILNNILSRICTGVYVNEQSILRLKQVIGTQPVLYLPSHRSYADFVLMSYICFAYDLEIPGIAAGMGNILAFIYFKFWTNKCAHTKTSMQWSVSVCCCAELVRFLCEDRLPVINYTGTFSRSICGLWLSRTTRALSSSLKAHAVEAVKRCHQKLVCYQWHWSRCLWAKSLTLL